jgi:hypothetical protein
VLVFSLFWTDGFILFRQRLRTMISGLVMRFACHSEIEIFVEVAMQCGWVRIVLFNFFVLIIE